MDEHWIAKRSQLRQLLQDQPDWTNQMYAEGVHFNILARGDKLSSRDSE